MRLFGLTISRSRLAGPLAASGGWFPVIREPYTGAWQQNAELTPETALANPTVFACVTLIASDIGKVRLRLVQEDESGIWTETSSPAFSPVLRKPNRAQTIVKFLESWLFSKLLHGNTYVLKERDARGVVTALYILDPARVTPLVTPDGAVYYQLAPGDGLIDARGRGHRPGAQRSSTTVSTVCFTNSSGSRRSSPAAGRPRKARRFRTARSGSSPTTRARLAS